MGRKAKVSVSAQNSTPSTVPAQTVLDVGSIVLCNLKLSFVDPFNPYLGKGTIISKFSTNDKEFAKVDWGTGHLSYYRLDKGELIAFNDDELKRRKLEVKKPSQNKTEVPVEEIDEKTT